MFLTAVGTCTALWACSGDMGGTIGGAGGAGPGAGGSSGAPEDGGAVVTTDLPCAVHALLTDHCTSCHNDSPDRVGPMALLSRADLLAPAPSDANKTVGQRALERMRAESNFMPPNRRLPENTIEPLATWVQEGMPASSCTVGGGASRPFEPLQPDAALAKVKTFLTGRAPTEAEYVAYRGDAAALSGLIDGWLATPEFSKRALEMLTLLFQQRTDGDDLGLYLRFRNNNILMRSEQKSGLAFRQYIEKSFAQTAWNIVAQGRPYTEVLTTRTYSLNVPLMALLARMDARPSDDLNRRQRSWIEDAYPNLSVSFTNTETIPWADSMNPGSPNFMRFSVSGQPNAGQAQCANVLTQTYTGGQAIDQAWQALIRLPGTDLCWRTAPMPDQFTAADREFRPVTIRLARAGERRSVFWDLNALRGASELVLGVEYLGFLGSLGFLGYWTTNDGNEYRVTTNQALIVALGRTFTTDSNAAVADTSSVDEAHATPDSPCYGCHKTLDPMRDFFRQSYSYWGSARTPSRYNETVPAQAFFTVDGSPPVAGNGVDDFAEAMATHPGFAKAWAQKICGLANARPCSGDDPELERVAGEFARSNYDFKALLRHVLSSPMITYRSRTKTWNDSGASAGLSLRDDLCRRLENRFGIRDACAARGELHATPALATEIRGYAGSLPAIAYERGDVEPQMAIDPSVFATAAAERLCERLAGRFLGTGSGSVAPPLLSAGNRASAIDKLTRDLMGVSSTDPRANELRSVLDSHWDEVLAAGQSADVALQSTFVLACTAPFTTTLGF
ncbi:MAG TPA: hypothetical protein VI072_31110 [Polyangiaceae bacterium]